MPLRTTHQGLYPWTPLGDFHSPDPHLQILATPLPGVVYDLCLQTADMLTIVVAYKGTSIMLCYTATETACYLRRRVVRERCSKDSTGRWSRYSIGTSLGRSTRIAVIHTVTVTHSRLANDSQSFFTHAPFIAYAAACKRFTFTTYYQIFS